MLSLSVSTPGKLKSLLDAVGIEPATFDLKIQKFEKIQDLKKDTDIEGTRLSSEISPTRTDLTS